MRSRIAVLAAAAAALLTVPALPGRAAPGPGRAFSHAFARQISRDTIPATGGAEGDTQVEPDIDLDPHNPANVVAVFQQGRYSDGGSQDPGFASSLDSGRTWKTGNLPGLTVAVGGPFDRASDPAVAFGPDGSVYASTLVFNIGNGDNGVSVQRSTDGGRTWGPPVFGQRDSTGVDDKNWIVVDDNPASPHLGRVYIVWDRPNGSGEPTFLRFSDDHGQTWSDQVTVSSPSAFTIGARPVVQPDGDVTVVYESGSSIVASTSHDGGGHFDPAVAIAVDRASDPADMRAGSDLPSAAVDPTTGVMDVVWGDVRFHSDGLMDAVISRSSDGGVTWSTPARVNQDPVGDGVDHLTPAVAANAGRVHVSYFTRVRTGGSFSNLVEERYIVSTDGGQTFGGELTLGPPIDLTYSARAGGKFLGDYMGIAASAHTAHPVWCRSSQPSTPEAFHQAAWSAVVF